MHEWFTTPIAAARMQDAAHRRRIHQLRAASGRTLWSRTAGPMADRAASTAGRRDARRVDAAVAVMLADGPSRPKRPVAVTRARHA